MLTLMGKRAHLAGLLTAALLLPAGAAAQSWSLGVGLGATRFHTNEREIAREFPGLQPGFDVDETATSLRLFASYLFDPILALDIEFIYLGDVVADGVNGRDKLFSVGGMVTAGRLRHQFSQRLIGFVRLGAFLWSSSDHDRRHDGDLDSGLDIAYGAGLDLNLHANFARLLRIEWGHHEFNDVTLDSADALTASVVFRF